MRSAIVTQPARTPPRRDAASRRRSAGFTLLEALVASVILGASVLAVISAMSAAQNLALEGQKRVLGAMAINDLMIELDSIPYSELSTHPPITQPVGELSTLDGEAYPPSYWFIGRTMTASPSSVTDAKSGAIIRGTQVVITAVDETGPVASAEAFFPEPVGGGA